MTKVIFFDFSGVVASSGYLKWATKHISNNAIIKDIFADVDLGKISRIELDSILSKYSGIAEEEILPAVLDEITVSKQIVTLIERLRKSHKVALLTNYSHEVLEEIFRVNNLLKLFDEVIISSKYGQSKPDASFFKTALNIMRIEANEAIFIDDLPTNIAAAQELGFRALPYTSYEKLVTDLEKMDFM